MPNVILVAMASQIVGLRFSVPEIESFLVVFIMSNRSCFEKLGHTIICILRDLSMQIQMFNCPTV